MTIQELHKIFTSNPAVSTDSRKIEKNSIFFALKGENFNGNKYVHAALKAGAAYAITDEQDFADDEKIILVGDVLKTLQELSAFHRKQFNIPVIAVTGSNGKTTTKELIHAVLSEKFKTLATIGNLNNHIGVPLTLLQLRSEHEMAVIEMGANHQNEIEFLCALADPTHGIITNIGKAHLEGFGGFEGVMKGKGELYDHLETHDGIAFVNADNQFLTSMSAKVKRNYFYGTDGSWYCTGELLASIPSIQMKWNCSEQNSSGEIHAQIGGEYNFENILAAVCIGIFFGVNPQLINHPIEQYRPENMRSQVIEKGSVRIILDAYNANPSSMSAALENFSKIRSENKIAILGDMMELGNESDAEHQLILETLARCNFKEVLLVGNNFGKFRNDFRFHFFDETETAADWLKKNKISDAQILIKGSRKMQLETLLDDLIL